MTSEEERKDEEKKNDINSRCVWFKSKSSVKRIKQNVDNSGLFLLLLFFFPIFAKATEKTENYKMNYTNVTKHQLKAKK